ncbi:MAG: YdcF family protein [Candidatus Saganbacteria bacterium]|nr:YdcF family protein [Candidatus Saganbacteria bacterium]
MLILLLIIILMVGSMFFFSSFYLSKMADFLEVSDPLQKADAIVVLSGGEDERVFEAARLYKEGWAPWVVMCGTPLLWKYNEADIMKEEAVYFGVPERVILLERKARSTYDNAEFVLPLLKKWGFKKIILVTSPCHSRRAGLVFKKVCSKDKIKVIVHAVVPNQFTLYKKDKWWTDHESTQRVVGEYMSLLFYWWKGDL